MRIAIIGAGVSAITAANALKEAFGTKPQTDATILIFEKSRGAGGRMSTRRTDEFEFDHGAQYFTVRAPAFKAEVERALAAGHMAHWNGRAIYQKEDGVHEPDTGGERYVSTPRMNSWIKARAQGLTIQTSRRVSALSCMTGKWKLEFEDGSNEEGFDFVICAVPAPQADHLLSPTGFSGADILQDDIKMQACFTVMAGFDTPLDLPWDTLRSEDGAASWIAHNSSKPGRARDQATVIIQSGPDWSERHVGHPKDALERIMLERASELMGLDAAAAKYTTIHRWLYASVLEGAGQDCLSDEGLGIIACGDWCLGGRVEGAYLSGRAAASTLLSWT